MKIEKTYKINVPHFYCLEYSEGDKKLIVEMDFRESHFELNKEIITKWEPPYQNEIITDDDKREILENIYDFLLTKTIPSNIKLEGK